MTGPLSELLELLGAEADPILGSFARAAARLHELGWAGATAGNLSCRLDRRLEFVGERIKGTPAPALRGSTLLATTSGSRFRDIAGDPLPALCTVNVDPEGGALLTLGERPPTSEPPVHVAAHAALLGRRAGASFIVHAHPTRLAALSLLYPEPESLLELLFQVHSEMATLRGRLAALPFITPGSTPLAEATGKAFARHDAVIWAKHGVVASGDTFDSAIDLVDFCEHAADIALLSGTAPRPAPVGTVRKRHSTTPKGQASPEGIETFFDVRSRDTDMPVEQFRKLERRPVHIVLDNLRSAFNVGSIFRLADATRIAEVVTCGYTAAPPHPKLKQTALGTTGSVPHRHFNTTVEALKVLRNGRVRLVAVETAAGAVPYQRFEWPSPVALIFGNEALGVSQSVLKLCDSVVEIPVFGYKNSVNVATAAAIVLYRILETRSWLDEPATG